MRLSTSNMTSLMSNLTVQDVIFEVQDVKFDPHDGISGANNVRNDVA
ncbi:hypothetical protein [Flavobacterium restrictum]|nr:hypothetical protein [Flavobacterium restrictum]